MQLLPALSSRELSLQVDRERALTSHRVNQRNKFFNLFRLANNILISFFFCCLPGLSLFPIHLCQSTLNITFIFLLLAKVPKKNAINFISKALFLPRERLVICITHDLHARLIDIMGPRSEFFFFLSILLHFGICQWVQAPNGDFQWEITMIFRK